jgi:hypothetical protein
METKDFTLPYTGKGKSIYGKITLCAIFTDQYGNKELHALVVDERGAGIIHLDTIYSYELNRDFSKHIG